MNHAPVRLAAVAALLLLAACATSGKEDPSFGDKTWEGAKKTTDQVADETVDAMKKTGEKAEGALENLWK